MVMGSDRCRHGCLLGSSEGTVPFTCCNLPCKVGPWCQHRMKREGMAGVLPAAWHGACCGRAGGREWGDGTGWLLSPPLPRSLCSHVDTKELCGRCPAMQGPRVGCGGRAEMGLGKGNGGHGWEGPESSYDPDLCLPSPQITLWITWGTMRTCWPPWKP